MSAEHWLSYTHSDQEVLKAQTQGRLWDSLVVPATVASYQPTGTSAYVRSLHTAAPSPFIIDPRTPLLQPSDIRTASPRASHLTVAAMHHPDVPEQWSEGYDVGEDWWTDERWTYAIESVLDFEESFERLASPAISKYQEMLAGIGASLEPQTPRLYVGPYWAVDDLQSRWWTLSRRAIEMTNERYPDKTLAILCLRPTAHPSRFVDMIDELPQAVSYVACWWGRWDESRAEAWHVDAWLAAAKAGANRGIKVLNMYGGALSALMCGLGLGGLNHGVGYSESRDERRLTETGAPPMRYYLPGLRMFMSVPDAQQATNELVSAIGAEHRCSCLICRRYGGDLLALNNDELKAHFLLVRADELRAAQEDISAEVQTLDTLGTRLATVFTPAPDEDPDYVSETELAIAERGGVLSRWAQFLRPHLDSR